MTNCSSAFRQELDKQNSIHHHDLFLTRSRGGVVEKLHKMENNFGTFLQKYFM